MDDAPQLLEFLGCMLGKAMYEGILLELPLARECVLRDPLNRSGCAVSMEGGAQLCELEVSRDLTHVPPIFKYSTGFFLKKFRGGVCDLNDLPSLDDVIYDNLRKLRQNPVRLMCSS